MTALRFERDDARECPARTFLPRRATAALALVAPLALASLGSAGCSRHRQEAVILAQAGDKEVQVNPEGAAGKYEQATKLDPTSHRIFFKLAMAQKKKEEWDKVSGTLRTATRLAPKFANYWFELGWALEQQAKKKTISYDEAKEPYQKCVEADPNYDECYWRLANVYLWTDDEQKTLENLTKAIEHAPSRIDYYAELGDLYIRLGRDKEAEQVLKEAKGIAKPGEKALFGVHSLLATIYRDREATADMVVELEAAKKVAPQDGPEAVQVLFSLGATYATMTPPKTQEAIQMLKGFQTRACKSEKAKNLYKNECMQSTTLLSKLESNVK